MVSDNSVDHRLPPAVKRQTIGDVQIQYLEYESQGPPVVLLHATGFLPWLWHPVARLLADKHRVLAPYFCDHRPMNPEQGGLDWLQLAADLQRFCAALHLEQVSFVGHSMGATVIALAHAMRGLPAEKIVLIEPIFLPSEAYLQPVSVDRHPMAAKALKRRNHWRDRQEAQDDFEAKPFFQSWHEEVLDLYLRFGIEKNGDGFRLTCSPASEAALFMGGMHHDPWPELSRMTSPTLVMEGEKSDNRAWIDLRRAAGLMPQGRYVMIEGAGHLIPMEKPAETGRVIASFLD